MKHSKKSVKIINTVFFIIAALLICGCAASFIIARNYRRYEGTYINRRTNMSWRDYGYYDAFSSVIAPVDGMEFERKDIVRITESEGGYDVEYIMSADGDTRNTGGQYDFWDETVDSGSPYDEPLLLTGADNYREYHGFISERAAREGGIVECYEQVTGGTKYIGIYFTRNGVCVLDDIDIGFFDKGTECQVSSWGKKFEYDSEYTIGDMLTLPKKERKYWIASGNVCICERTGYNIYAALGIAGSVTGAAAAVCGAAAVIMAAIRGRKKAAAIGLAVFAAAAAAAFAFIPAQSIEGRYYFADLDEMYFGNVIQAVIDGQVTVEDVERNYEYIDISRNGNGNYTVLFYKDGSIDAIAAAKTGRRGKLTITADDGYIRSGINITPTVGGISVTGKNRPLETEYGYERLNAAGLGTRLGYIILLSFAVCVVVLLTVSVLRYKHRRKHPVICEGSYRITDILYMDGNMDYMKEYMLKNWRGVEVELKDSVFAVDGKNMGAYECVPKYEAGFGKLINLLRLGNGVCVKPAGNEEPGGDYAAEYCMIYNRRSRAFVYGAGGQTLAVFALRPKVKDCGVGI